jgi:hypothetical protein
MDSDDTELIRRKRDSAGKSSKQNNRLLKSARFSSEQASVFAAAPETQPGEDMYANSENDDEDEWAAPILSQTDNPTPMPQKISGLRFASPPGLEKQPLKQPKAIHDRVHGQVNLQGLLVAVMDTPEFQRCVCCLNSC